jgi:catalase-peroxidase
MSGGKKVSLADLIVLGGNAAIEQAAKKAGQRRWRFPSRRDARTPRQEQTDVESFAVLEPTADGFRNYFGSGNRLIAGGVAGRRANLLTLTVPEMTVLVGGMRALDANAGAPTHGVFTDRPGTLSNDFFVNLLDMSTQWSKSEAPRAFTRVVIAHGRAEVDGHPRRSHLRVELRAARSRRGLCGERREREVRA